MPPVQKPDRSLSPPRDVPAERFTEDTHLLTGNGERIRRFGSVAEACRILDGCYREDLTDLIKAGVIRGYKLKPHVRNSHYRVDLLSVWEHKQRQMGGQ